MKQERDEDPIPSPDASEKCQDKKPWITPVVSESPVNELTGAAFSGTGTDNTSYS